MNAVGIDVSKGKSMVAVLRSLGVTLVVLIQNDFRFRISKPVTSAYCFHLPEHLRFNPFALHVLLSFRVRIRIISM